MFSDGQHGQHNLILLSEWIRDVFNDQNHHFLKIHNHRGFRFKNHQLGITLPNDSGFPNWFEQFNSFGYVLDSQNENDITKSFSIQIRLVTYYPIGSNRFCQVVLEWGLGT